MRVCIHRGTKQIGGSCIEIESKGKRLLIDLGQPLITNGSLEKYLPNISGLRTKDPSLLGILISHPHMDHFGLLPEVDSDIPIGMGAAAHRMIQAAAPFMPNNWKLPQLKCAFQSEQKIKIGPFIVTPYLVDHSAYDSYSLLIESDGKRLFYTGDFRAHGRKSSLFEKLISHPPQNVDSLLIEGTSINRASTHSHPPTEVDIENQFYKEFTTTEGIALIQTSAQNIDRIVSIYKASQKAGRNLLIDLYAAEILAATGCTSIPQSFWNGVQLFIPQSQKRQILNRRWFKLLKSHSRNRIFPENLQSIANKSTLLFRSLHMKDLELFHCLENAKYFYSQWEGYWKKDSFQCIREWLEKHNIPKKSIHTSGHATPDDLQRLSNAIEPSKITPIHSFFPNEYRNLFNNVVIHDDGEWWDV